MRAPRPRRYVSSRALTLLVPFFRYSHGREAYVLRIAGSRVGPVLREERRRPRPDYDGPERRRIIPARGSRDTVASGRS